VRAHDEDGPLQLSALCISSLPPSLPLGLWCHPTPVGPGADRQSVHSWDSYAVAEREIAGKFEATLRHKTVLSMERPVAETLSLALTNPLSPLSVTPTKPSRTGGHALTSLRDHTSGPRAAGTAHLKVADNAHPGSLISFGDKCSKQPDLSGVPQPYEPTPSTCSMGQKNGGNEPLPD